jgi:salicylate hydroxylase
LERRSVTPSSLLWRRWETGTVIGRAKLNPASMQRYGSPYYVTHRAHLHDVLHERTKELQIPIYLNRRVHDYDVELGKVVFAGGEVITKDLVIAADGKLDLYDCEISSSN